MKRGRVIYKTVFSDPAFTAVRLAIAGLFLYAGIMKLSSPESFAIIVEDFGIVPESWAMPVAVILPIIEIVASICLAFDFRGSLTIIAVLLTIFIGILGYGILMGLDIDCGCFGPNEPETKAYSGLRTAFWRDLVLMSGVIYLYCRRLIQGMMEKRFSSEHLP